MDAENVLIELQSCVPMDCGSAVSSNASFSSICSLQFHPFAVVFWLAKNHTAKHSLPTRVEQSSADIKVNREK